MLQSLKQTGTGQSTAPASCRSFFAHSTSADPGQIRYQFTSARRGRGGSCHRRRCECVLCELAPLHSITSLAFGLTGSRSIPRQFSRSVALSTQAPASRERQSPRTLSHTPIRSRPSGSVVCEVARMFRERARRCADGGCEVQRPDNGDDPDRHHHERRPSGIGGCAENCQACRQYPPEPGLTTTRWSASGWRAPARYGVLRTPK